MEPFKKYNHSPRGQRIKVPPPISKNNSNSGFIMLGSLIFFVGLLAVFVALLTTFQNLQKWKSQQHSCRQSVHKAQTHLLNGFVEIMSLNPEAQSLRLQRKMAEQEVKAAPDPVSKSAAAAHLVAVILRQQLFSKKQKLIIRKSKNQARAALAHFKSSSSTSRIPFALKRFPPSSMTPDYLPTFNLQQKQKIEIKWKTKFKKSTLASQCGSTITQSLGGFKIKFLFPVALSLKGSS